MNSVYYDDNIRKLNRMAPDLESQQKIHRMTEFCRIHQNDHVPDPYYGGASGFELVLDLLEDACDGLIGTPNKKQEESEKRC